MEFRSLMARKTTYLESVVFKILTFDQLFKAIYDLSYKLKKESIALTRLTDRFSTPCCCRYCMILKMEGKTLYYWQNLDIVSDTLWIIISLCTTFFWNRQIFMCTKNLGGRCTLWESPGLIGRVEMCDITRIGICDITELVSKTVFYR